MLDIEDQPKLIQAIFQGDSDQVRSILYNKFDVNYQDDGKRTALHAAAFCNEPEILELLMFNGARVNAKDAQWLTPLHRACCIKSDSCVMKLLDESADINARDKCWQTPLHVAAANNAVKCAELLLKGLSNVNVSDRAGRTSLHHASLNGHVQMTNLLLEKGAIVNAFDKKDRRPIHYAAYMGHVAVLQVLVQHGAEINCKDFQKNTPLHAACASGQASIVYFLLDLGVNVDSINIDGNSPLHIASLNGQDLICTILIEHNADIDLINNNGDTSLHYAAISSHGVMCLEILLGQRGNPNIVNNEGQTPLHKSCIGGRMTRCKMLIDSGAITDLPDNQGYTPLHKAARYGHKNIVEILLENGAVDHRKALNFSALYSHEDCFKILIEKVNTSSIADCDDNDDKNTIHAAACGGSRDILYMILKKIPDVNLNAIDKEKRSAIHYACLHSNYDFVKALLDTKAVDCNLSDENGATPLHYAAAYDNSNNRIVDCLLEYGANFSATDDLGYNALHYASFMGNTQVFKSLLTPNTDLIQLPIYPIHLAAYNGHCDAVQLLADVTQQLDVGDNHGNTPLHLAAGQGHSTVCQLLLSLNASMYVQEAVTKSTPLHLAAAGGHLDVLKVLLEKCTEEDDDIVNWLNGQGRSCLMLSSLYGHTECVQFLLSVNAHLDSQDYRGHTALSFAAGNGFEDIVDILLEFGCDALKRDKIGRIALHYASMFGGVSVVSSLQEVDVPDFNGYTALHWSCYFGHDSAVDCLLQTKSKDYFVESYFIGNRFSPLHCACLNGFENCCQLLFEFYDAKNLLDLCDDKKRRPLHMAAFGDNVDIIKYLKNNDANIHAKDIYERTPLFYTVIGGSLKAFKLMITMESISILDCDCYSNSILHYACLHKQETIAKLILKMKKSNELINVLNDQKQNCLHLAAKNGLIDVVKILIEQKVNVLAVDKNGHTPALACAPDFQVAQCLNLILQEILKKTKNNNLTSNMTTTKAMDTDTKSNIVNANNTSMTIEADEFY